MALIPEFNEAIEVNTPPISPVLFDEDSFGSPFVEEVPSPVKRVRLINNGRQSKRRKTDKSERVHSGPTQHDSSMEAPHEDEVVVDDYTQYVAAVAEKRAGFYPLSKELFVVQGWDDKSSSVKVSLIL